MKITSFIIAALAVFITFDSFSEPVKTSRRRRPAHMVKPSGGLIFSEIKGKAVAIINFEKVAKDKALNETINDIKLHIRVPIKIVEVPKGAILTNEVASLRKKEDVSAVIALSNCECTKLLKYEQERNIVYINVSALSKDRAPTKIVNSRLNKQIWRAVGAILNAGEPSMGPSIIKRADTIKELDAIKASLPEPMQHNRMVTAIDNLGMKMIKAGTYRSACQQGWAPAPKTEEQKKIWNEIHATPKNPIKITFDPKKGR